MKKFPGILILILTVMAIDCKYGEYWDIYMDEPWDEMEPSQRSKITALVDLFEAILKPHFDDLLGVQRGDWSMSAMKDMQSVKIDYETLKNLLNDEHFAIALRTKAETVLPALGLAIHMLLARWPSLSLMLPEQRRSLLSRRIHPRLCNYQPVNKLRDIKANTVGQFVCVRGTVVRVSNTKPITRAMVYNCTKCMAAILVKFAEGKVSPPQRCPTQGCRSKSFIADKDSAIASDWQRIRIQELVESHQSGRVPRTIDVELTDDLVDTCVPGDVVSVVGVVKVVPTNTTHRRGKATQPLFFGYIDANNIENNKQIGANKLEMRFTPKDMEGFQRIVEHHNVFGLLCKSICPHIFGLEMVKAGLTLALFGGSQKIIDAKGTLGMRGDIHVLIVGDPGLGKSQLLQSLASISPRGVYLCGSYASESGLTVAIHRDSGSQDYTLEAGALVLSDQGMCCVDEFDKMTKEWQALLEAMEQQTISIAKAGIVCNLPARSSLVAAANPVNGHYDRSKTIAQNLKMNPALLSRFDLIFILLDKPDEMRDHMLSDHIMKFHTLTDQETPENLSAFSCSIEKALARRRQRNGLNGHRPLIERLKDPSLDEIDPIPPTLLRKYIAHAKLNHQPRLSPEAIALIQEYYLQLRQQNRGQDTTPITTRQLESLIRMSEARALLELRDIVTVEDAMDVIEIMQSALQDVLGDDPRFQVVSSQSSQRHSQRNTFVTNDY